MDSLCPCFKYTLNLPHPPPSIQHASYKANNTRLLARLAWSARLFTLNYVVTFVMQWGCLGCCCSVDSLVGEAMCCCFFPSCLETWLNWLQLFITSLISALIYTPYILSNPPHLQITGNLKTFPITWLGIIKGNYPNIFYNHPTFPLTNPLCKDPPVLKTIINFPMWGC